MGGRPGDVPMRHEHVGQTPLRPHPLQLHACRYGSALLSVQIQQCADSASKTCGSWARLAAPSPRCRIDLRTPPSPQPATALVVTE